MTLRKKLSSPWWYLKLVVIAVLIYLAYALLSFALVATWGKYQLEKSLSDYTGADVTVQRLWFNPFANSLTVNNFQLAVDDNKVIGVDRIYANVELAPLWDRKLTISEFSIVEPYVHIIREKDGTLNLQTLFVPEESTNSSSEEGSDAAAEASEAEVGESIDKGDDTDDDALPITPVIEHFELSNGSVAVTDRAVSPEVQLSFPMLGFEGEGLTLEKDRLSRFRLALDAPEDGRVEIEGSVAAIPFDLALDVTLKNIVLSESNPWLGDYINGQLVGGVVDATSSLTITGDPLNVKLKGDMTIADGSLVSTKKDVLVGFSSLAAHGFAFDLNASHVGLKELAVKGITGQFEQFADGTNTLDQFLKPIDTAEGATDEADDNTWQVDVDKVTAEARSLAFVDHTLIPAYRFEAAPLSLAMEHINLAGKPIKLTLNSGLGLAPVTAKESQPQLDLKAKLATSLELTLLDAGVRLQGDAQLSNYTVVNGKKRPVMAFDKLAARGVRVDTVAQSAVIGGIRVDGLTAAFQSLDDGTTTLDQLLPATNTTAADTSTAASTSNDAWRWHVATLDVNAKQLDFTDYGITPPYRLKAGPLQAHVSPLDADGRVADLAVTGKLDGYADLSVKGKIAPLADPASTQLTIDLTQYDMTKLSPYTGLYIGHKVDKGRLTLATDLNINGSQLSSKSKITADKFYLGDKVKSDQATKAPVGLGLSILRNRDGQIGLPLKVSGDLSDPGVSVHGLVLKALLSILTKAATSPLSVLSLLPNGAALEPIAFATASDSLDSQQQSQLEKLSDFMESQPKLSLALVGTANAADAAALTEQGVKEKRLPMRLEMLARQRAEAVRAALVEQYGIGSSRLYMSQPSTGEKQAGVLLKNP